MQEKGIIPKDVSFVYIVLLNTWEYTLDKFQSNFSHSELRQLIFSFGMIDLEFEKDLFSFVLNKYEKIGMNRSLTRASILNSFSLDGKKDTEKLENIFEQIKYCIRNGVYTVRINDSTGKLNPDSSLSLFKLLNSTFPEVSFGLHTHNDHGLSLINTLKSVEGGCNVVEGSLAGFGNRAGITDLFLLVKILSDLKYDIGCVDLNLLREASIEVERAFLLVPNVYRPGSGLYEKNVTTGILNIPYYLNDSTVNRTYSICADSLHPKTIINALKMSGANDELLTSISESEDIMSMILLNTRKLFEEKSHTHKKQYSSWYDEMIRMYEDNSVFPNDILSIAEIVVQESHADS